jgi:hypothetical protein
VILGLGVFFTQEKTPSNPLAFGKPKRRWLTTTAFDRERLNEAA